MLKKLNLAIGRTCSYETEHFQVGTWLFMQGMDLARWEMAGDCYTHVDTRYRIHNSRNSIARWALDSNIDYLVFVDGDMHPDFRLLNPMLPPEMQPNARSWARPFIRSSLEFMRRSDAGVIGAPAVGIPPENKLNVFIVDHAVEGEMRRMKHDDMRKIQPSFMPVVAIGTGLMMIDMDVFRKLPEPWFFDEEDERKYDTTHSQDCNFCIRCNQNRIAVYANLFSPARHIKFQGQDPPAYEGDESCLKISSVAAPALPPSSPTLAPTPAKFTSPVSLLVPSQSLPVLRETSRSS